MRKLAILPYTLLSSLIIRFLRKFYQNAHRLNGRVLEKAVKITTGTQMPFGVFISQSNRCFRYTVKLLAEFDIFSSICVEDMDLPVSFAIIRNDKKKTIFLCQSRFTIHVPTLPLQHLISKVYEPNGLDFGFLAIEILSRRKISAIMNIQH